MISADTSPRASSVASADKATSRTDEQNPVWRCPSKVTKHLNDPAIAFAQELRKPLRSSPAQLVLQFGIEGTDRYLTQGSFRVVAHLLEEADEDEVEQLEAPARGEPGADLKREIRRVGPEFTSWPSRFD